MEHGWKLYQTIEAYSTFNSDFTFLLIKDMFFEGVFEGSKGGTIFNIRVHGIPDDGTLGTNCIIRKQGVGGGNIEIKGLSGIVVMDVGLDNKMVVWEVR